MIGVPGFGFTDFDLTAEILRGLGHEVFSPAEKDRAEGFKPTLNQSSYQDVLDMGFDRAGALWADLDWIFHRPSDGMVVLPSWPDSPGTKLEIAAHQALYLPVWELEEFLISQEFAPKLAPLLSGGITYA